MAITRIVHGHAFERPRPFGGSPRMEIDALGSMVGDSLALACVRGLGPKLSVQSLFSAQHDASLNFPSPKSSTTLGSIINLSSFF